MRFLIYVSQILVILAGLNIGFIGFFEVNPIEALIPCPMYLSLLYALIGLAALLLALIKVAGKYILGDGCGCGCGCCTCGPECTCGEGEQKAKKAKK